MPNGDIGAAVDTLEFDLNDITYSDVIHVSGSIYAIAYTDAAGDGIVVTVDIEANGQIGAAIIDSLEFDTTDGNQPRIIHVSGDIFAIVYKGVDGDGFIVTVDISTAGAMGAAVEDSLEFETNTCHGPNIVHVEGNVFAIAYQDGLGKVHVATVVISTAGAMGAAVQDDETPGNISGSGPKIIHVSGSVYAISYSDGAGDGWIMTVDITSSGTINASTIDTLEFETDTCYEPDICHALGDIFVIAYRGGGDDGFVSTVIISTAGAMGAAREDVLEFDTASCFYPNIIHIGEGICAIAYTGELSDGFLVTIQTSIAGAIDDPVIDSEEFDTDNCNHPSIIHVAGNTYAIAYAGNASDGFIKTPLIETPVAAAIKYLTLMGIG